MPRPRLLVTRRLPQPVEDHFRADYDVDLNASDVPMERAALMDEAAIAHFIAHYERLTRHILAEMPGRADLIIRLNDDRGVIAVERPEPRA